MLVVLEGLDGAGKSTQVRMLKSYLEERTDLHYIHFPRYEEPVYGGLISRFLKGEFGTNEQVHPQLVALLFAEDRHGAVPEITESLESGRTVLLDRYVYSNIAYQCAKLKSDEEAEALRRWIFRTEFDVFGEPRPDVNIFLDVPLSFVEANLASERKGADRSYLGQSGHDIHEASIEFQSRVRQMYLRQASEDPSLTVVGCSAPDGSMLPAKEIFERIKAVIDPHLV